MTVPAVGSSAPEMRLRSQYGEPLDLGELLVFLAGFAHRPAPTA